jgi:class 3 adenylate cyclase
VQRSDNPGTGTRAEQNRQRRAPSCTSQIGPIRCTFPSGERLLDSAADRTPTRVLAVCEAEPVAGSVCSECGQANREGARFCDGCGDAIASPRGEAGIHDERRQVTVLFSDASGYTSLAEHLDPEVVREVMGEVYGAAREIVERYGGRVDKLMGDAVLAVFGDPVAHEDDAERAVRAALDLHGALRAMAPSLQARVGRSFEMHSGINTGVIIASNSRQDRDSGPLGDMVNVAARLQSLAGEGEIIVGAETIALVGPTFELEDLGELQLKGRTASVGAARVTGVAGDVGPSRRSGDFVGRQEALGVLLGAVDQMRDGVSSILSVSADAGAGKTRLFEELRSRLSDDVVWVEGRAHPYTSNVPYAPIVDMLSRVAGIDEADGPDVVRPKLESFVDGLVPGDVDALAVVNQLFGARIDRDHGVEVFGEMLTSALGRLLSATASRGPTIVCFQDLHWVDPSTAELIRVLARDVSPPRVTICNFRPSAEAEIDGARQIELGELSPRETRAQLASMLDGARPPDDLALLVLARAGGNPFFAEEIVNSLLDQALLTLVDGEWVLSADGAGQSIPSTVRGLLASRIDMLDPQRKQVLREASVVGREFLHRVVQSVASEPDDLDGSLALLTEADLIRVKMHDPELEYIFKHALIQEVAYEGLVTRDRQRLHRQVARSLDAHFGDRSNEIVETLAFHYQRSGDVVPAVRYLRLAGGKALAHEALSEAHRYFRSAYELLTQGTVHGVDRSQVDRLLLETLLDWSHAFYYQGNLGDLRALQLQHETLAQTIGDPRLSALWNTWRGLALWFDDGAINEAIATFEEAVEEAIACGDVTARGYAAAWLAWATWGAGEPLRSAALWEEVRAFVDEIPDPYDRRFVTLMAMGGAAIGAALVLDISSATRLADELLQIGRSTGNRRATALGHIAHVAAYFSVGDTGEAVLSAQRAVAAGADPIYAATADVWAIGVEAAHGDIETVDQIIDSVDNERRIPFIFYSRIVDVFRAQLDVLRGDLSRGDKRLQRLRPDLEAAGDRWMVETIDAFYAAMPARIASGEVEAQPTQALRNPSFAMRHGIRPAHKARDRLASLMEATAFPSFVPFIEIELAKLEHSQGRTSRALAHAERVRELLADYPESTHYRVATALIAGNAADH